MEESLDGVVGVCEDKGDVTVESLDNNGEEGGYERETGHQVLESAHTITEQPPDTKGTKKVKKRLCLCYCMYLILYP